MRVLIVYDSVFGNTEKIAQAMATGVSSPHSVQLVRVGEFTSELLDSADICVVGSPTRAFKPTQDITTWYNTRSTDAFHNMKCAAFDTRVSPEDIKSPLLRCMVKTFGYASKHIHKALLRRGGGFSAPPEGFFVQDKEGPLKAGEEERASLWMKELLSE